MHIAHTHSLWPSAGIIAHLNLTIWQKWHKPTTYHMSCWGYVMIHVHFEFVRRQTQNITTKFSSENGVSTFFVNLCGCFIQTALPVLFCHSKCVINWSICMTMTFFILHRRQSQWQSETTEHSDVSSVRPKTFWTKFLTWARTLPSWYFRTCVELCIQSKRIAGTIVSGSDRATKW